MEREIKFRGYHISHDEWIYGFLVNDSFRGKIVNSYIHREYEDSGGRDFEVLSVYTDSVGQFTGLKDKNGKDIYEGDIVQYKSYHAFRRWWNDLSDIPKIAEEVDKQRNEIDVNKSKVIFQNGSFSLESYPIEAADLARGEKFQKSDSHNGEVEYKYWDFEVIGNIYETPELLNK